MTRASGSAPAADEALRFAAFKRHIGLHPPVAQGTSIIARSARTLAAQGATVAVQHRKQLLGSVELRRAVAEDSLCLSVLAMQVFLDTYATEGIRPALAREVLSSYSQASFNEAIATPRSEVVVAEHNGHMVGFAQVTLFACHELAPGDVQAELLRLYVQEPFTGLGVGTKLLAAAENLAIDVGATVMWLTPWVHNHRALAFYARRGYGDFGLTCFTFEGESHENRVLAKLIHATSSAA